MPVDVRPVRSRRDLMRFIRLPWRLYRNQRQWVPPLIGERRRHLDRSRNPFFEHAEAEYFLAWRDGRIVALVHVRGAGGRADVSLLGRLARRQAEYVRAAR